MPVEEKNIYLNLHLNKRRLKKELASHRYHADDSNISIAI